MHGYEAPSMNLIKTMQRATIMAKPSKVVNNSIPFFIAYSSFFLPKNDSILNNFYWMIGRAPLEIHSSPRRKFYGYGWKGIDGELCSLSKKSAS